MRTIRAFVGILAIVCAFAIAGYSQSFLTNGLVAYYPFNGNANDASGNGNNGTNYGATFVANQFGIANSAVHFNQSEILTGFFPPLGSAARTFSGWFQSAASSSMMTLMAYGGSGGYTGDRFELVFWASGQFLVDCSGGGVWTTASYTDSTWHNFVVVVPQHAALSNVVVYMDGVSQTNLIRNAPGNIVNTDSVHPLQFGMLYMVGDPRPLTGSLSDVRIYNRALSASEVQQLYLYQTGPCFRSAAATATVVNGFVVAATLTDGGCGYTNTPLVLIEGGGGSGATAVAIVTNGIVQEIMITDAGSGYTNPPTILVGSAPAIAAQPQSVTVNLHQSASFNVSLANPTPVAYQWSFNGTNLAGATSSSLTITNVTQSALGLYSVLLTSAFGATNSSAAVLSMYPYLAMSFGGVLAYWGQDTTLSVQAGGSGPLTYQWYQNGSPLPSGTNTTLLLSGIQFTNAGTYWVVVSNSYGSVTNMPAQVLVNPAGVSLGLYPGVTITGTIGYNYIIQSTTDLNNTNSWVTRTNLTLTQPVELWVDTNTDASLPHNSLQFYRVLPGQ
jgi:hypothetical protein